MIDPTKLDQVLDSLETEHGPFVLAGLFMREDSPGLWDLVVSAPWLQRGKLGALEKFVKRLSNSLGQEEVFRLSRIVTLNRTDPALKRILHEVGNITRPVEKAGQNLFGLPLAQAYIFRAHRRSQSNKRTPQKPRRG
jgi:predicted sugar kinase